MYDLIQERYRLVLIFFNGRIRDGFRLVVLMTICWTFFVRYDKMKQTLNQMPKRGILVQDLPREKAREFFGPVRSSLSKKV